MRTGGRRGRPEQGSLPSFAYWITVRDGPVAAIEEQFIP